MGEKPIFDREEALRRMANSPAILAKVVSKFKAVAPSLLGALEEAFERQDAEAFHRAAHSLKGAALNLGAERLVECAGQLEATGLEAGRDGLEAAGRELAELLAALEAA